MYKYKGLLTTHNLTEETVSTKMKASIKKLTLLEEGITEAQEELAEASPATKKELLADIDEAKSQIAILDNQLCVAIPRYARNADTYKAAGDKLNKGRKAKGGTAAGGTEPAAAEPAAAEPAAAEPAAVPGAGATEPAPVQTAAEGAIVKKDKSSGWLFGGLIVILAAAVGINYYNNKS